jgi:hypothetical protein
VIGPAAGRLVLYYLPTYSIWLNPIEILWRHFRCDVTHWELFETDKALLEVLYAFYQHFDKNLEKVLSIIGAHLLCVKMMETTLLS